MIVYDKHNFLYFLRWGQTAKLIIRNAHFINHISISLYINYSIIRER